MKKILEAFKGAEGEVSSKRLVGIVGAFILFATFCANSFSHIETAPSDKLVEAVSLHQLKSSKNENSTSTF
jgi:hypothetical protein